MSESMLEDMLQSTLPEHAPGGWSGGMLSRLANMCENGATKLHRFCDMLQSCENSAPDMVNFGTKVEHV